MKRKTGASAVMVVVLVVVIVACVGFTVYWVGRSGAPAEGPLPAPGAVDRAVVKCYAPGCNWKGLWPRPELASKETGKGLKGLVLYKCPTCGKFSVAEPGEHQALETAR